MSESIERHLRTFFEGHDEIRFSSWPGAITTRSPSLRVMVIPPGPKSDLWTYSSVGAHTVSHGDRAHEFFVLAPEANESQVELVTMVAYYHADPDPSFRLGLGHTVPIGRPWLPNSQCTHLLVSLPHPFGHAVEECSTPAGLVRVLWLLPITDRERAFKVENGLEAIEQRFDDAQLEYWRADRPSVV